MHRQFKNRMFSTDWGHPQLPDFPPPENRIPMAAGRAPYMTIRGLSSEENGVAEKVSGLISYTFYAESVVEYGAGHG